MTPARSTNTSAALAADAARLAPVLALRALPEDGTGGDAHAERDPRDLRVEPDNGRDAVGGLDGATTDLHVDGGRVTLGCSGLGDGRWVPVISVDPHVLHGGRYVFTAGRAYAQSSRSSAIAAAREMAHDWRKLVARDLIATIRWFGIVAV